MTTSLRDLLQRFVEQGTVPGAVGLRGGGAAAVVAVGAAALGGPPMRGDAIFRIQSMTKAITAVAALRLVEAGHLALDDGIERWLPELADRRVLASPTADLDDTVPANGPITVRHLLVNGSGYGIVMVASPLREEMARNGTEAGPEPPSLAADDWLRRIAELPLAFQPGEGWRYHHSYGILGILLSRVVERPLTESLTEDLLEPLGMRDTGFWVPEEKLARLLAVYRHTDQGLTETEPAGAGFYAGQPAFDVSHGELVSTADDYRRFLRLLIDGGVVGGRRMLSAKHLHMMTTDQVPVSNKTPDSFFPGFWDGMGWGFGVAVQTTGRHRGRYGWSGGLGTDFFVDPDDTLGILLTQVELDDHTMPLVGEFQELD